MADNSFQSEEPIYNPRLKNVKKSTEYSSSVPISMPAGKNSPPVDDQEVTELLTRDPVIENHVLATGTRFKM